LGPARKLAGLFSFQNHLVAAALLLLNWSESASLPNAKGYVTVALNYSHVACQTRDWIYLEAMT
jgi:hypothetical protein